MTEEVTTVPEAVKPKPKAAKVVVAPVKPQRTIMVPTAGTNWKSVIVLEMALLFGGVAISKKAKGTSWQDLFLSGTLTKGALATVILLALLLTMEEVGAGGFAAAFGGLIVLGYFLAAGGILGQNVLQVEQSFFGGK